jgi:hypothetical protein
MVSVCPKLQSASKKRTTVIVTLVIFESNTTGDADIQLVDKLG